MVRDCVVGIQCLQLPVCDMCATKKEDKYIKKKKPAVVHEHPHCSVCSNQRQTAAHLAEHVFPLLFHLGAPCCHIVLALLGHRDNHHPRRRRLRKHGLEICSGTLPGNIRHNVTNIRDYKRHGSSNDTFTNPGSQRGCYGWLCDQCSTVPCFSSSGHD